MSVFLISETKVTDDSWGPDYATHVHPIVEKHGGKYLSRSGNVTILEGSDRDNTLIAILEFPNSTAVESFIKDPEYAPYAQARQAGGINNFQMIDDTDIAGTIPYLTAG